MLAAPATMEATAVTIQGTPDVPGPLTEIPQLPNLPWNYLGPEEDQRRRELCEAALGYAKHGWRVLPVRWITSDGICSCQRGAECPSPGKHPVHDGWPDVATSDTDAVASWWRPSPEELAIEWFPEANVGMVTGAESGIWVLDVDPRNGGEETLDGHERRNGAARDAHPPHRQRRSRLLLRPPGL